MTASKPTDDPMMRKLVGEQGVEMIRHMFKDQVGGEVEIAVQEVIVQALTIVRTQHLDPAIRFYAMDRVLNAAGLLTSIKGK